MATRDEDAPGELELVRAFVNTLDGEDGADLLSSPPALAAWFREHGLMRAQTATGADLAHARRVREALRALLLENNGLSTYLPRSFGVPRRSETNVAFGTAG